jgi:hypothetical protein
MIAPLLALLMGLFAIWCFGDLFIAFACRFVCMFACVWANTTVQRWISQSLLAGQWIETQWLAESVATVLTCIITRALLLRIRGRLAIEGISDGQAVLLDTFRVALTTAMGFTFVLAFFYAMTGGMLQLRWLVIVAFVLALACLDVGCPTLLGKAAGLVDGSFFHVQR